MRIQQINKIWFLSCIDSYYNSLVFSVIFRMNKFLKFIFTDNVTSLLLKDIAWRLAVLVSTV